MIKMIRQIFILLTPKQLRQFITLQLLVTIMAFCEIIGIASIAPFMAIVGDNGLIQKGGLITDFYHISGAESHADFIFLTGIIVLLILSISTFFSMFTVWRLSIFASRAGAEIADRLYVFYMTQNWLFHANNNSSRLTKQISTEVNRITEGIIQPLMLLNAKAVLAFFISIGIFIFNPIIALIGLLFFFLTYVFLYKIVKFRLHINGKNISLISTERYKLMSEGFGGIKDVLLLGRKHSFIHRFKESGKVLADSRAGNITISQAPRYFMELIAFGAMITLILILIKLHKGNLGEVLPILAIYALAILKLLPSLQQIYGSTAQIKGNLSAFESIKSDFIDSFKQRESDENECKKNILIPLSKIELKNVTFTYPGKKTPALINFNIDIAVNSVVGIVGSTGSGKSTAIDILLGLIAPDEGNLYINNVQINEYNKSSWQNNIGFVPQNIFLSEGTITQNIAFGLTDSEINIKQVEHAAKLANLEEFLSILPKGLNTKVGERGVQLSGGQRQRIGIARALYHEADVLVFDEATSALDGITEKVIMEAIHNLSGRKTIVMIAHRLKTVRRCDVIYFLENGRICDAGTFNELVARNPKFKEMAEHA